MFKHILLLLIFSTYGESFNLSIIHFNDFHARFDPICNAVSNSSDCMGGFSRLYSAINRLKKTRENPIVLNAGDNFKGTLWYTIHKWNVTQHFLNKLPLDAITLGNHEFDDKIDGLLPFLQHIRAPIIVCNIDDSNEPRIQGFYNKSVIIEREGKKIGIIGVILATTNSISNTEKLLFLNEVESVNKEAENLIDHYGVFTNIVLSHCGYEIDLEIARKASAKSRISAIVGGHTDTFLFTGSNPPGPDKPSGPYPTIITNDNANKVLVVQASAYTKYLGDLIINYNQSGSVTKWFGAPIFLSGDLPTDPEIDKELDIWRQQVSLIGNKVMGYTPRTLYNKICRAQECALGNFVADSMVFEYSKSGNGEATILGLMHAGGIRENIFQGNITYQDLITTFPFESTFDLAEIRGDHLKEVLEERVNEQNTLSPHLFQVSGIRVVYNISKESGNRVMALRIKCGSCRPNSEYKTIDLDLYYKIVLPSFLTKSDFFPLLKNYTTNLIEGRVDLDVIAAYLKQHPLVDPSIEGRIKFI